MKQNPQQVSLSSIAINTQAEQEQLSIYLSFLLSLATKCEGKANQSAITCGRFDRSTTTTKRRFQQELAACKRRLIQAIVFIIILFFLLLVEKSIFQDRMTGIRRRYQTRWGAIEFLCLKLLAFGQDMNAFFLLEDDIIYEF